jgi:cell division protein FtsI/penicillin-binding protein 2
MDREPVKRWVVVGAGVVVAAIAIAVALSLRGGSSLPTKEVDDYLSAWERYDTNAMNQLVDPPAPTLAATVTGVRDNLHLIGASYTRGKVRSQSGAVIAPFTAKLQLGGLGEWRYDGQLRLVKRAGKWRVAWTPASVEPDLGAGQRLTRTRIWPTRAPITGNGGATLAGDGQVIAVGLEPDRITDRAAVDTALKQVLGVDPAKTTAALNAPGVKPNFFVSIQTMRPDAFAAVRPKLDPVGGVVFQRTHGRLGPIDNFAPHVVGRVGEITADRLHQLGQPYAVGDTVGLTGLEAAFERRLAGAPSGEVRVVDAKGAVVKVVDRFPGATPAPVATTIDVAVQEAAQQALVGVTQPAALVALDAPTGAIQAVVSVPADQAFDRALDGHYPPGSTFKVVTATALLANGTSPDSPVSCPPQATVGGKKFTNFEGEAPGSIPFRTAFAISCNTAFVGLADKLPVAKLTDAATAYGFGAKYKLALSAFGGNFPKPADDAEKAAAAIGQGRVEVSPLHMATVAAAADSGGWRQPRLLPSDPSPPPTQLDQAAVTSLHDLMAGVVTSGTGTAAAVAGQSIFGKTGTAEFGNANPPSTHAWFIGFRGDLAFSVLVEGGGVGGRVAAPIAARFLRAVPQ